MRGATVKNGQHLVHFFVTKLYGVAGASNVLSFHDHLDEMRESAGRKPGFEDAVREALDYAGTGDFCAALTNGGAVVSAPSSPPHGRQRSKASPSDTSHSESTSPPRLAQRSVARSSSAVVRDASGVVRVGAPQFSGRIIASHQPAERSAASVAELMCGPSGGTLGVKRLQRCYENGSKRHKAARPGEGSGLLHIELELASRGL
jgi:hypothetical protein